MKSKYKLVVKEGYYESDHLTTLFYEILKHRLYHLFNHKKWIMLHRW